MRRIGRLFWLAPVTGAAFCLLFAYGCTPAPKVWGDGSPRIVVTIPPLASFAHAVAGDRAEVKCICTARGPHDFVPDFRDSRVMKEADVVFAVGLQLDDSRCADALHRMSGRGDKLPVHKLGDRLRQRNMVRPMRPHKHDADAGGHHHSHGEHDPHVWLGPAEAAVMVELIRDVLCELDPKSADDYKKNAAAYKAEIVRLHEDARKRFAAKKVDRIVSFHDAFDYFANGVGLKIADVIEIAPGVAPSQGHIVQLQKLCRETPVGAITVEPQYDVGLAKQLQEALRLGKSPVELPLVQIDPLETAEEKELLAEKADWYLSRMKRNVEKLDEVLK